MSDFYYLAGKGLTERELGIVRCLAEGMSNREAGKKVFLTENTIKTHMRRVTQKLQAKNRTHVVAICYQRGLL